MLLDPEIFLMGLLIQEVTADCPMGFIIRGGGTSLSCRPTKSRSSGSVDCLTQKLTQSGLYLILRTSLESQLWSLG